MQFLVSISIMELLGEYIYLVLDGANNEYGDSLWVGFAHALVNFLFNYAAVLDSRPVLEG